MKGYGQFCPVAKAAQIFCRKWTPLILRDLAGGPLRFAEIQRGVPLMSPALLSRRLRELVARRRWQIERHGRPLTRVRKARRARVVAGALGIVAAVGWVLATVDDARSSAPARACPTCASPAT